jgi:hypothetical protein
MESELRTISTSALPEPPVGSGGVRESSWKKRMARGERSGISVIGVIVRPVVQESGWWVYGWVRECCVGCCGLGLIILRMRNVLVACLVAVCIVPMGSAQTIRYENGNPIPTLSTVKLSTLVRSRIEGAIFDGWHGEAATRREVEANTEIRHLKLGPGKQWAWEVTGYGDWCGGHGTCSIWLFDPASGASLLEDGSGNGLNVTDIVHRGRYDVEISYINSCCTGGRAIYQFDGRQYRLIRNIEESFGTP